MSSQENILRIENLSAGYDGKPVLQELNLTLRQGETCCVIGEEGSGKSTLLKAITHQIKSSGKIIYNGIDLSAVPTAQMTTHGVDFIAQGGNILKGFTVDEHISLALSEKRADQKRRVWQEVERTFPKLSTLRNQVAGRLSGGERMILSVACVLATDADFLVLDEPTAGLAPETCTTILEFLIRMKCERGKTVLLLEHNYEFAFEVADSVVTLIGGALSEKYLSSDFKRAEFIENKLYTFGLNN
jgi:ABC-type branched-subunit amino acid transport system ATPase component